jgi:hypothetical protein
MDYAKGEWGSLEAEDLARVKQFEAELDRQLQRRESLSFDGPSTLCLALSVIDYLYSLHKPAHWLGKALSIVAPNLRERSGKGEPPMRILFRDMEFASQYFSLRELLYYTYNVPGSITWHFSGKQLTIRYADRSIPRQFYHTANGQMVGVIKLFENFDSNRTLEAIRSADLKPDQPAPQHISDLICEEIDLKMRGNYSLLDENLEVRLGAYTYKQFLALYKHLVGNALIHRYWGRRDDKHGVVTMQRSSLIDLLTSNSGLEQAVCASVVDDLTYPAESDQRRFDAIYFGMFALPGNRIAMSPNQFLMQDGVVNGLRLSALRDPGGFLKNVSEPLGVALVTRIASAFERQGFTSRENVNLRALGEAFPDIDLMVISKEKTLGYVLYLCEVKNVLPPMWAKDHLRVLNKDSVAKAFGQLDRVMDALQTEKGIRFLRSLFPDDEFPHLRDGFLIAIKTLVITSHNAGMFFADQQHIAIDYRTLERILAAADGDVVYINRVLADMNLIADRGMKMKRVTMRVGPWRVTFEGVTIKHLTDFTENAYKSAGVDQMHLAQFIKDGGSAFDVLRRKSARKKLLKKK